MFICGIYGNVLCFLLLLVIDDDLLCEGLDVIVVVVVV